MMTPLLARLWLPTHHSIRTSLLHKWPRHGFLVQKCEKSLKQACGRWLSTRTCQHIQTHSCTWYRARTVDSIVRGMRTGPEAPFQRSRTAMIYMCALGVFMVGMTYAGVPLYRMFCRATGTGGQAVRGSDESKVETMETVQDRVIKVRFNADTHSSMQWNFRPQQSEVRVLPGETALAFYTAMNPTDKAIIGISTYNVVPFDAGQYFNKIQCFCFEEQRLNPHEKVDMPVFFYIDPEFADDPRLAGVDMITLSYTFFEAKDGMQIPLPGYMQNYSTSPQPQ